MLAVYFFLHCRLTSNISTIQSVYAPYYPQIYKMFLSARFFFILKVPTLKFCGYNPCRYPSDEAPAHCNRRRKSALHPIATCNTRLHKASIAKVKWFCSRKSHRVANVDLQSHIQLIATCQCQSTKPLVTQQYMQLLFSKTFRAVARLVL